MEAAVRAFRRAFAREHARGIFTGAAIGIHAGRVRIRARQVFLVQELDESPQSR
jgi:hypothetical protein